MNPMNSIDVAEAIERFANKLADELVKQSKAAIMPGTDAVLVRAAWAVREAGKTNRTRRREERERLATHDTRDDEGA